MLRRPLATDGGGIPLLDGDKDRPSDYLRDVGFLYGKIGDSLKTLLVAPKILSGLVASVVGNVMTVTAGEALIYTPSRLVKYHDYNGEYLGQEEIPAFTTFVVLPADITVDLTNATKDGSTLNYLVGFLKEIPKAYRRKPVNPTADYPFLVDEVLTLEPRLYPAATDNIICGFYHYGTSITLTTDRSPDFDLNSLIIGDAQLKTDVKVGSLANLRSRIATGISLLTKNVVNALNYVDQLLQTHTDRVDNPHSVGLSQLSDVNNMGRRINNLADAVADQDAVTLAQLTAVNDALSNALTGEANARASADTSLQNQINAISIPSTSVGSRYIIIGKICIQFGEVTFIDVPPNANHLATVSLPVAYAGLSYEIFLTAAGVGAAVSRMTVFSDSRASSSFGIATDEFGPAIQSGVVCWMTIGILP